MQTRKYPRTLTEAFGPYTSQHITETQPPMDWQDKVVTIGCFVVVIMVMGLIFWGRV